MDSGIVCPSAPLIIENFLVRPFILNHKGFLHQRKSLSLISLHLFVSFGSSKEKAPFLRNYDFFLSYGTKNEKNKN